MKARENDHSLLMKAMDESNLASKDSFNFNCFSLPTLFHLMALSSLTFLTTDRTQSSWSSEMDLLRSCNFESTCSKTAMNN